MTLIALNYFENRFWAFSDSRVSHKPHGKPKKISDRFTKTYLVPYRFTSSNSNHGFRHEVAGRVGFAFAGDILAALAIQAMTGNILENMHDSIGKCDPPSFDTILHVFLRAAELLHEETIVNPRPYEAFIFGFCPAKNEPRLSLLTLKKEDTVFKFKILDLKLTDGMTYSIGSGATYFRDFIKHPENCHKSVEKLFQESLLRNPDKSTGGAVQLMSVYRDCANYEGVLQPIDEAKENFELYVSGVSRTELGDVEGYELGRVVIGISVSELANRQELIRLGYEPDSNEVTQSTRNMAAMLLGLRAAARDSVKLELDKNYELVSPKPKKKDFYFSTACKSCYLITPLLIDETKGQHSGLISGKGKIWSACIHCCAPVELRPHEMLAREWK